MKPTLTLLLTLGLASLPALRAADPATGTTGVTQSPVRLHMPPDAPQGDTIHYGLPQPFQIGPRTAAVFVSRHMHEKGVGDYVNGNDVFVFDSLASLAAAQPLAMDRNDIVPDPVTGEKRVFEKWTGQGGFVPLGALRADGTPHPHAGTGFHFYQSFGYFMKENGAPRPPDPKNPASQPQARTMFYELSYDGKQLRFVDQSLPIGQHLFTEDKRWRISSPSSLRTAIPDGDDLLLAVRGHGKGHYSGVSRWARRAEGWRPVSFQPVPEAERVQEADLARDADGSLLFTFRPADRGPTENYALRVWRSRDGGASWERIVEVPETIGVEPRTVGTAADGSHPHPSPIACSSLTTAATAFASSPPRVRSSGNIRRPRRRTAGCCHIGHGFTGKQPMLFEVTPDKKVVWEFADHARFKTVCQVQILDTPADPLKGEVRR